MRTPAAFALANKGELALTREQVGYLEALVKIEVDSSRARMLRIAEGMPRRGPSSVVASAEAMMSWTGPVDEAGIRATACEQSKAQAELMIGMMRDRHAVGAVLTPAQQHQMDWLQAELMRKAVGGP
jgi:Spy/CpxP family protein refolding chaperone